MLYNHLEELIGNTPILALHHYQEHLKSKGNLFAKLEMFNPCGSAKDRIALMMIEKALEVGIINEDTLLVEPTSGNTGIALSAIARAKQMKTVIVMPETMSEERKQLLKAYGAELVLTSGSLGMQGAMDKANEIVRSHRNAYLVGQFSNTNNPLAHYLTTGPEILRDLNKQVDIFVAGIGTGGSISGIGKYLKEQIKNVQIIGVEPADSPLLSEHKVGKHDIQGIGANFIPDILDFHVIDKIMSVSTKEAYQAVHELCQSEGVLVGISSGAALHVAKELSLKEENKGKNIVVLLPDSGERYLTTALFKE